MEDMLALYEQPWWTDEQVVCVEEESVTCTRMFGKRCPCQRDRVYKRNGTAKVFCWGRRESRGALYQGHRQFLARVCRLPSGDRRKHPEADTVHLVMDNLVRVRARHW